MCHLGRVSLRVRHLVGLSMEDARLLAAVLNSVITYELSRTEFGKCWIQQEAALNPQQRTGQVKQVCESEVITDEERNEREKRTTTKKTSQKTPGKPFTWLKIKKREIKKEQPRRKTKQDKQTENQEQHRWFSSTSSCHFSAGG